VTAVLTGACFVETPAGCLDGYGMGGLADGCLINADCACPFKCDAGFDLIGQPAKFCQ